MNLALVYILLLKATVMSFSGLGSLPIIRDDFVVSRQVLTDRELNIAVTAGRASPGPFGLYVVCVGYAVKGIPGAIAGLVAVMTPAFLAVPMMLWLGKRADSPRIRDAIRSLVLGSAGLILAVSMPLTRDALQGPLSLAIMILSFAVLTFTRITTAWLILAAAATGLAAKLLA